MTRPSTLKASGFTLIELLVVIAIIALLAAILFPVFGRARENARRASCISNMKQMGLGYMQYLQDFDEYLPPAANNPSSGQKFGSWIDILQPYIKSDQIFVCPSSLATERFCSQYGTYPPPSGCIAGGWRLASYSINAVYWFDATGEVVFGGGAVKEPTLEDSARTIFAGDGRPAPGGSGNNAYQVIGNTLNQGDPQSIGATNSSAQGQFVMRHFEGCSFLFFDGHAKWMKASTAMESGKTGKLRYFTKSAD